MIGTEIPCLLFICVHAGLEVGLLQKNRQSYSHALCELSGCLDEKLDFFNLLISGAVSHLKRIILCILSLVRYENIL